MVLGWWYFATRGEKALVIMGVVALALLAIIIASPHVKPLGIIANRLGLVQVEVVTRYVPVYINHTIYINRTITINQTVPIYINNTTTSYTVNTYPHGVPIYNNTGTCSLYSLVFSNGTIWTLGYWAPTPLAWRVLLANNTLPPWLVTNTTRYGRVLHTIRLVFVVFPGLGTAYLGGTQFLVVEPGTPVSNWSSIIYIGDLGGTGPLMYLAGDYRGINNGVSTVLRTWGPPMANTTGLVLPVNSTYTVLMLVSTFPPPLYIPSLAIPCNWTFIGPVSPGIAPRLPAPLGGVLASESYYVINGSSNYPPYEATWGWWVWRVRYQPVNTSTPWPVG